MADRERRRALVATVESRGIEHPEESAVALIAVSLSDLAEDMRRFVTMARDFSEREEGQPW